jgi:hypothetical protein
MAAAVNPTAAAANLAAVVVAAEIITAKPRSNEFLTARRTCFAVLYLKN